MLEQLRQFPAFATIPDEQLQWLVDNGEEKHIDAGTVLAKPGESIDQLVLLLDGRIVIDTGQNGPDDDIVTYEPHSIMGVLPYSRMTSTPNRMLVEKTSHILQVHRDKLRDMACLHYELTEVLVQQMTNRVRSFTRYTQQEDKMASLGRLSAGLAHELNNPVAAIVRSAETMKAHLRATPDAFKQIMHLQLPDEKVDTVNELLFKKLDQKAPQLSLLERSSREDDLADWLDDYGADTGSLDLVGPLIDFNFTTDDLNWMLDQVGPDNIGGVTNWVVNNLVTQSLVRDISDASERIGTLVGSIKNYTHMDRGAGKTTVDLGEGIRSTLTLLDHKVKGSNVSVRLNLADDLPVVCGWPGELNQVWTNLIDNAVDAMPDGGELTISSEVEHHSDGLTFVLTKIADTGTGIPDDIRDSIFDPFFTTKEIGKGTGLGLDIVQGIVSHHNGSIKVDSQPGHTEFSVCLPVG
ncbi:ATP-binding protein [Spirosoma rhododendri]|uniref:histidine kinase n=1 Tax=Spirosoma rhododendri TaxID=2728024 RepID=A0A7L5DLM4_9BACT|nr:ATP-binding protein [Spirosoma rhododendri]QJD78422.1 GHKL domain-containing protein [Spirosoma rhododendri]